MNIKKGIVPDPVMTQGCSRSTKPHHQQTTNPQTTMTNYQLNKLETILAQNGVSQTCAVMAGEDSGFSFIIEKFDANNRVHFFFSKMKTFKGERYGKEVIHSAFVPSDLLGILIAYLNIPASRPIA